MSKRLRVPIKFTGYIPPARVHNMYHLGDVFVCPTQYREGFATVNSEAMASGIPVVSSRRGGIPEVIKDGRNGLLVSAYKSPAAFARAIERIKLSPALASKLANEGRKRVRAGFSWFSTVRKLKAHYRKLG
jgi:spore coat protein SA